MDALTTFLKNQKILAIAPHAGDPWIANVFIGCEDANKIYFIGNKNTLYGQKLIEDPRLAFATAWHAEGNHLDRKGIQGVGEADLNPSEEDIAKGVALHNQNYPEFAQRITIEWIHTNEKGSGVWTIAPSFIKFWNDDLYGQDGSKEFTF